MTAGRQLAVWLAGLVALLLVLWLLSAILLPFVVAMAIAYFLDPLCTRLERLGLSRSSATWVVCLAFLLIVAAALALLVPAAAGQAVDLAERLPAMLAAMRAQLLAWFGFLETRLDPAVMERLREALTGSIGQVADVVAGAVGGLLSGGLALVNLLALLFLTPVVTFFLLRDWNELVGRVDSWLPRPHVATVRRLAGEADRILAGYARGAASVCLLLAAFYGAALTILGLPSGLFVGIAAGFLSFIPFVGTALGFVLSVGLALLEFDSWLPVLLVAGVFALGQVAEGNFLTPRLVGRRVGLHPVVVIFALLAGGALFGFTGVLLAMPVAAVAGVGVRFALERYLASRLYLGEPPSQGSDPT